MKKLIVIIACLMLCTSFCFSQAQQDKKTKEENKKQYDQGKYKVKKAKARKTKTDKPQDTKTGK